MLQTHLYLTLYPLLFSFLYSFPYIVKSRFGDYTTLDALAEQRRVQEVLLIPGS